MCANAVISRRGFLQAAAGFAGALALPSSADAANPYYRPISYQPDYSFSKAQLALVGKAVNLVAARMLDPRMLAYAHPNFQYYMVHAPGRTFRNKADFEGWFHYIQMQALRVMGFPPLYVYGQYDAGGSWTGRGSISSATAEYASVRGSQPKYYTQGKFVVTLNTALLGNGRLHYGNSADYWAGAICHEMLHNLGHQHPVGVYNGQFMRAYENAVARNAG